MKGLVLLVKCVWPILLVFLYAVSTLSCIYYIYSVIGIIAYFIIAHLLIENLMRNLWKYVGQERGKEEKGHKLTATLGNIDRIIYAVCFALSKYTFIGVWIGIKMASRLITYTNITNKEEFQKEGERKNLYLLGNITSLVLGLLGGLIIKIWLIHNHPSFLNLFGLIE